MKISPKNRFLSVKQIKWYKQPDTKNTALCICLLGSYLPNINHNMLNIILVQCNAQILLIEHNTASYTLGGWKILLTNSKL